GRPIFRNQELTNRIEIPTHETPHSLSLMFPPSKTSAQAKKSCGFRGVPRRPFPADAGLPNALCEIRSTVNAAPRLDNVEECCPLLPRNAVQANFPSATWRSAVGGPMALRPGLATGMPFRGCEAQQAKTLRAVDPRIA